MNKIERVEEYIYEFFKSRYEFYTMFYYSVHKHRKDEIYLLENGNLLMDLITSIHGSVEEQFFSKKLIPNNFASPDSLFFTLNELKKYLNENQKLISPNLKGEDTHYIITDLQRIKDELVEMIDYSIQIYDFEDSILPYQDLRYHLVKGEIKEFIDILKSLFASLSYSISKSKEGYYHSNVHLILKLLGFNIRSEEETNKGRIDALINFVNTIYIVEFKFSDKGDSSDKALRQILDKKYHEKYLIEKKKVIALGVSFSNEEKNISGFKSKVLKEL